MQRPDAFVFSPEAPPGLEHAPQIREEALDWLDTRYPGVTSFTTGQVLRMAGEQGKRWLIARLRSHGIGDEEPISLPAAADALTALFLRSKGVKFREAVDAVAGGKGAPAGPEPRYGGIWNRLILAALDRLRREIPPRLLGAAAAAILPAQEHRRNCLIIAKRHGKGADLRPSGKASPVSHDVVYRTVLERPAPSCAVVAPSLEVLLLERDQLPTRSEVTSRHFVRLHVETELEVYELLLGTMRPAPVVVDGLALGFAGRALDLVFPCFEEFQRAQASLRFEAATQPETGFGYDLELWLVAQFLNAVFPGSLIEISEAPASSSTGGVLASSAVKPWEASPWDPPKTLEMLAGYASRVGVPLVVERVEPPWTMVIESVESEMRYLKSIAPPGTQPRPLSAIALPIPSRSGGATGSLYLLAPGLHHARLAVEVRILSVLSGIVGEMVGRQREAAHFARTSGNLATLTTLEQEQFRTELLHLLGRTVGRLRDEEHLRRDARLPFLLLSAQGPQPEEFDPSVSGRLKKWLVETLRYLDWRPFVRSRWPGIREDFGAQGFMGQVPGGMMIALGELVSKDELDQIRNAFPTSINRVAPTNAPVKLVAWVLDVPAERILSAARAQDLPGLADEIEEWAFHVAAVVEDVAESSALAREEGEWEAALRRIRKALQKEGARNNSYLRRLAADCSFALGDWPSALKYAQEAVRLSTSELGSGLVRSLCQEGDAHLCLCEPSRAWDRYSDAVSRAPNHPLPRYYRGQALMLIARLLDVYEGERRRASELDAAQAERLSAALNALVNGAMEDLTAAADLLDRWGLIPESYQYRNFHLLPTLLGQGLGYLLARSPGPAASRLQSARRSFPKDDLFFREFLFAKGWEQGLHRRYGELLLRDEWAALRERLDGTFGEPHAWLRSGPALTGGEKPEPAPRGTAGGKPSQGSVPGRRRRPAN